MKSIILLAVMISMAFTQQSIKENAVMKFTAQGKTIAVYTTVSDSNLRLAQSGTLKFEDATQPSENEIAVFVNPDKQFQTFLGIGGAIRPT